MSSLPVNSAVCTASRRELESAFSLRSSLETMSHYGGGGGGGRYDDRRGGGDRYGGNGDRYRGGAAPAGLK